MQFDLNKNVEKTFSTANAKTCCGRFNQCPPSLLPGVILLTPVTVGADSGVSNLLPRWLWANQDH